VSGAADERSLTPSLRLGAVLFAAPAHAPARPPIGYYRWDVGRGRGPVPLPLRTDKLQRGEPAPCLARKKKAPPGRKGLFRASTGFPAPMRCIEGRRQSRGIARDRPPAGLHRRVGRCARLFGHSAVSRHRIGSQSFLGHRLNAVGGSLISGLFRAAASSQSQSGSRRERGVSNLLHANPLALFGAGANACRQACEAICRRVHGATQTGIIRQQGRSTRAALARI